MRKNGDHPVTPMGSLRLGLRRAGAVVMVAGMLWSADGLERGTVAAQTPAQVQQSVPNADELLVVDCLLPGQIRRLGRQLTFLGARRAIKTTARDCEICGGEYVAYDRATYQTALKVWQPLAEKGDAAAQA